MIQIEAYSQYEATFKPIKTDDLKNGSGDLIGWCGIWEALWIIESGEYKGQWAMGIYDAKNQIGKMTTFIWVPECDLEIHKEIQSET